MAYQLHNMVQARLQRTYDRIDDRGFRTEEVARPEKIQALMGLAILALVFIVLIYLVHPSGGGR